MTGSAPTTTTPASPTGPAASRTSTPAREWRITSANGVTASGHLPAWAQRDPSQDGVPSVEFGLRLRDLTHHAEFVGQTISVHAGQRSGGSRGDAGWRRGT